MNRLFPRRIPLKDLIGSCLILVLFLTVIVAMVSLAGAAELPLFAEIPLPDGQTMVFTPGPSDGQTAIVLRTSSGLQCFTVAPVGRPTPAPDTLTGLAKEVRDWATALVPAEGRRAEAKRLAAGYRVVAERATKGELATLLDVQQAQAVENRKALGIPLEDAEAGKTSRWYPVIQKLAEWLQANPPTDAKAMGPISLEIAQGLEAVP